MRWCSLIRAVRWTLLEESLALTDAGASDVVRPIVLMHVATLRAEFGDARGTLECLRDGFERAVEWGDRSAFGAIGFAVVPLVQIGRPELALTINAASTFTSSLGGYWREAQQGAIARARDGGRCGARGRADGAYRVDVVRRDGRAPASRVRPSDRVGLTADPSSCHRTCHQCAGTRRYVNGLHGTARTLSEGFRDWAVLGGTRGVGCPSCRPGR